MSTYTTPRTKTRTTIRLSVASLIVVTATIVGTLVYQSASSSPPFTEILRGDRGVATIQDDGAPDRPGRPPHRDSDHGGTASEDHHPVTEDDGLLPDGVTVFDVSYPGVANLEPDLLQALRTAATDAADDGIEFYVNSGWRSPAYQDQLLREAVAEYGSEEEAARWVATADTSAHVSGDAVDLGGFDATTWLSEYGAGYGLCQIYGNEPWHFELHPGAIDSGCPAMFDDPTQDPRMQQ
ncbi:MAG TPA: M15 family metallopeptidase [Thermomicrobiales bacterium]|nr:M15 family metallopeptidase [Thermomicrobiales bacterium]